jgi:predicted acyltransferase (DUF342 family)
LTSLKKERTFVPNKKIKIMAIVIGSNVYSGNNITIEVYIDGKKVSTGDDKNITIEVTGNVNRLEVDSCNHITVKGDAGFVKTLSGSVECGNVEGSVQTISGNVECGDIGGSVSTVSGNVKHKKINIGNIGNANFM